eukprot:2273155-Ditylum_brightwellii.AAC.1
MIELPMPPKEDYLIMRQKRKGRGCHKLHGSLGCISDSNGGGEGKRKGNIKDEGRGIKKRSKDGGRDRVKQRKAIKPKQKMK